MSLALDSGAAGAEGGGRRLRMDGCVSSDLSSSVCPGSSPCQHLPASHWQGEGKSQAPQTPFDEKPQFTSRPTAAFFLLAASTPNQLQRSPSKMLQPGVSLRPPCWTKLQQVLLWYRAGGVATSRSLKGHAAWPCCPCVHPDSSHCPQKPTFPSIAPCPRDISPEPTSLTRTEG